LANLTVPSPFLPSSIRCLPSTSPHKQVTARHAPSC
jgi:hypothetical protein